METTQLSLASIQTIVEKHTRSKIANPDENLLDSGILTSLISMNVIIDIESTYKIRIPNEELNRNNLSSLNSIHRLVARLLSK